MMRPYFIRSTIFNLCFYVLTGICCVILLPTLVLPRKYYMAVVYGFVHTTAFLEKYILGLTYETRGKEYLPDDGSYIIAAKHQSAYETFKLHILFNDPAIVLKKELLKIPLWGKYLAKSDVIAIDRSTPKIALKSLQDGAKHVMKQGRSILIFPQGTRVSSETSAQEKPYKIGIIRIQEATDLPIIPMALNTGIFYPKHKWCKKPGTVIFEFLPPVLPSKDHNAGEVLKRLEMDVEEKTAHIMDEAKNSLKIKKSSPLRIAINLGLILCLVYTAYWFSAAYIVRQSVLNILADIRSNPDITEYEGGLPRTYGFPWKLNLSLEKQIIKTTRQESYEIGSVHAKSWPFPEMPITFSTDKISIKIAHWKDDLVFDGISGTATHSDHRLTLENVVLTRLNTQGFLSGTVQFSETYPIINLNIALKNHQPFLLDLVLKKIIKEKPAAFAAIALQALEKDGIIKSKITSQDNKVYLGPIRIYEFPDTANAALLEDGKPSAYATKRAKPVPDR